MTKSGSVDKNQHFSRSVFSINIKERALQCHNAIVQFYIESLFPVCISVEKQMGSQLSLYLSSPFIVPGWFYIGPMYLLTECVNNSTKSFLLSIVKEILRLSLLHELVQHRVIQTQRANVTSTGHKNDQHVFRGFSVFGSAIEM